MAGITPISLNSGSFSAGGEVITNRFFGGNILFDRDKIGPNGTFDEKVAALNVGLIRYPGGTISEQFFSFQNPNRTVEADGYSGKLLPLGEFSQFVKANGYEYALVVPTIRYMQGLLDNTITISEIRAEFRTFLKGLKSGQFGAEIPQVFELGNEYYTIKGLPFALEADLYGKVAKAFALEIRAVLGAKPEIAVQSGINEQANTVILSHFAGRDYLINSVVAHSYPWTLEEVRDQVANKMALADKWTNSGIAETVFLSEWNISDQLRRSDGTLVDPSSQERGMANAVALLEMMGSYLDAGVDLAAVWPLQQRTATDLAGNEGDTSSNHGGLSERDLSLIGEAFRLMSEALPGTRALRSKDIDLDGAAESARYRDEVLVQAFDGDKKVVVFVSAWNLTAGQLGTKFTIDLAGDFRLAEVTRLHVGSADDNNPNAKPIIEQNKAIPISRASDVEISLDRPYEIYRIVFTKMEGLRFSGTSEADHFDGGVFGDSLTGLAEHDRLAGLGGKDTISGGNGNDTLDGGDGHDVLAGGDGQDSLIGLGGKDTLRGGKGDDQLHGGADRDYLYGNGNNDRIFGQDGDDLIYGQNGADTLDGDAGNDLVSGGKGNDVLFGGHGADTLVSTYGNDHLTGGAGADLFVFAFDKTKQSKVIHDYQLGIDRIQFHGDVLDLNTVRIAGTGNAVIAVGDVAVTLLGVSASSLSTDSFEFVGSQISQPVADLSLIPDVLNSASLGNGWRGLADADGRISLAFNSTTPATKVLSFDGYDVDYDDELEVFLNGTSVGFLSKGQNNGFYHYDIELAASLMAKGYNLIEVAQQGSASWVWGVANVVLRSETAFGLHRLQSSDYLLEAGVENNAKFGNRWDGILDQDGRITAAFVAQEDSATFSFKGFDIDHDQEVELLLNGNSLGMLAAGGNGRLAPYQIDLDAGNLVEGVNQITFLQKEAVNNIWGIQDLLFEQDSSIFG